jgi:hypothetical protein
MAKSTMMRQYVLSGEERVLTYYVNISVKELNQT